MFNNQNKSSMLRRKPAHLPRLWAERDNALFTGSRFSVLHVPLFYRRWRKIKKHRTSGIQVYLAAFPSLVCSQHKKKENTTPSYLYKAVYHRPDTFVQTHPETQTKLSRLLAVTRGQTSSNETNLSSDRSPWWGRTCGKCSRLSEKTSWGQWRIQNTISGN